jgi:hypothetical protein
VGLIVSGAVYWLLSRSTDVSAELAEAADEGSGPHPPAVTVIT